MCDQFVTQLQKGGNKVRKRGRQKKWVYPSLTKSESLETIEQLDEVKSESSSAFVDPEVGTINAENDVTENNEVGKDVKVMPDEAHGTLHVSTENLVSPKDNVCTLEQILHSPKEDFSIPKVSVKKEEESSDEDAPLSLRQTELKKVKETKSNVECSGNEDKSLVNIPPELNTLNISLDNIKQEDLKTEDLNQENKESSESEAESSADDESTTSVAKRLRVRKPKEETESKRKTRSSEKENANTSQKGGRKKKEEKKKSLYGDGSEFRPGWEAEVYRYKRSLRMPARLINIAGPQSWPRLSVSLPDLDPDSPMTLDSDLSLQNKKFESDGESTPTKTRPKDSPKNKLSQKKVEEKGEEDSFINRLIQRYGGKGKKSLRKGQEKDNSKERKGPKIIPQSTELQLLPTPSLDCIVKSPAKKLDPNSTQMKQTKGKKSSKDKQEKDKPIGFDSQEAVYLGYFRKKTVADFRDAFAKHNGGFATEHELPPIMLKSRTRTQTRILTQRATIREVFGDDRPASAPPAGCRDEEIEHNEKPLSEEKKSKKSSAKSKAILSKRNSTSGMSPVTRSGLRNAAVLRSNKAVLKSKQHLLHGGERRKRSKDLIKAFTSNKKYHQDPPEKQSSIMEAVVKLEPIETTTKVVEEEPEPVLVSSKRLKYRSVRRKLKSSGFDYIRKKKKQQLKKEGDTESVKERKEKKKVRFNFYLCILFHKIIKWLTR
ncbi:hypothetical protein J6590_039929 [Homalodisca vitripennis]|nr:hypothetical protein J6590_039929 [Homalodisca vitripennis]